MEVVLAHLRRGAREGSCDRVEYDPVRDYVPVGLLGRVSDCRTSVDCVQIAKGRMLEVQGLRLDQLYLLLIHLESEIRTKTVTCAY